MKQILTLIFSFCSAALIAQSTMGEIKGNVYDEQSNVALGVANVYVKYGDEIKGTTTDFEGNFTLKPLMAGSYEVTISYMGYRTKVITDVEVNPSKITWLKDQSLALNTQIFDSIPEIIAYKTPLIKPEDPTAMTILFKEIEKTPSAKNPMRAVMMMSSEISTGGTDNELYFKGSRSDASGYYVDGVKMTGSLSNVPGSSIGSITVYTGGLPAQYGDATGGVVVIETRSYFDLYNQWKSSQL